MATPRQIAFQALLKTEKDEAYSNLALDAVLSKSGLDTRDKSFVSNLFYGVIERKLTLDYNLSLYLSKPLKKLKPEVLSIMRLGAYQILFMDKVPDSAAVNESIKLSKKNSAAYASGLINAVLRKICNNGLKLPDEKNRIQYLSVFYSCPEWLIEKWTAEYGADDTDKLLAASVGSADIFVRVNSLKITADELINIFSDEGVNAEKINIDAALRVSFNGKDIESLPSYKMGYFHVQDIASQLCAKALNAKENETVFDLCSAPGGKAYTVCEIMNNNGRLVCFDIHQKRVDLIVNGAKRLGLSLIEGIAGDASVFNENLGLADKILCDVPCSGFGIIRRKPEIKYKRKEDILLLPEIQYSIISNAANYLKAGGRMVYSTCTLSKAENEDICKKFLDNHCDFKPVGVFSQNDECMKTLMPHKDGSDGFFIACFERVG